MKKQDKQLGNQSCDPQIPTRLHSVVKIQSEFFHDCINNKYILFLMNDI